MDIRFNSILDLLVEMTKVNIEYGYYDKVNNKKILPNSEFYDNNEYINKYCRVLKPEEVWEYRIGTCWDTSLLL